MTGFGEASTTIGGVHLYLEIRSLNSKYFKAVIRLPEEFQVLEAELESALRHTLTRGSVFMTVHYSDTSGSVAYTINQHALNRYIEQLKQVPQVSSGQVKVEIAPLLNLPGVLQPPADEEQRLSSARGWLMDLLKKGCSRLIEMREREGQALLAELFLHRDLISDRLKHIAARSPNVMGEYEQRLRSRIQQMAKDMGLTLEPVDIVREVAICAERTDIAEEVARLSGHIEQFTRLISDDDTKPVGRTLDFLTQEMLREANTIASKCGDAEISKWTVEIKGAIDRIKEQVQNVE